MIIVKKIIKKWEHCKKGNNSINNATVVIKINYCTFATYSTEDTANSKYIVIAISILKKLKKKKEK